MRLEQIPVFTICAFSLAGQPVLSQPATELPSRTEILRTCVEVNDHWIQANGGDTNPAEVEGNRWDAAAYYTGNQRISEVLRPSVDAEATRRAAYLERARLWSVKHDWERGPEGRTHADAHCAGQVYIDLYRRDPQPVRLDGEDATTGILPTMNSIMDEGLTTSNDWHWIDAFYMAGPVFAKLDATLGEGSGRDYSSALKTWYLDMRDSKDLFDDDWGLWYRDASSKSAITENGKPEFWGRGNGWVIGGLVRCMEELGPAHPDYAMFADNLQKMSAALRPLQQSDGFWRASLADPLDSRWDNPETSATAFITYAMAWGIRNGVLDAATYRPVVAKAWNGMVDTAVHPDGFLGYVQNVARAPAGTDYNFTKVFGVGAFLLAGAELSLLAEDPPVLADGGPNRTLYDDNLDGFAWATLDASRTHDPDELAVSYQWWVDGAQVADGLRTEVELPLGGHWITLRVVDLAGNHYENDLFIEVAEPDALPSVTASTYQQPNRPENTQDGDSGTRWSAAGAQWLEYEFRMTVLVRSVAISFFRGDERQALLSIEVSTDGASWITVFDGMSSGDRLDLETFDFADTAARFVRINGEGNTSSTWNSYTEVAIDWTQTQYDGNENGLPDAWEQIYAGALLADPASSDQDGDLLDAHEEWRWGLDPQRWDAASRSPRVESDGDGNLHLRLPSRVAAGAGYSGLQRSYTVLWTENLSAPESWSPLAGYDSVPADGEERTIPLPQSPSGKCFYKIATQLSPVD